jgi:hypothetical protein
VRNDKQKGKSNDKGNGDDRSRFLPRSTTLRVRNDKQKGKSNDKGNGNDRSRFLRFAAE